MSHRQVSLTPPTQVAPTRGLVECFTVIREELEGMRVTDRSAASDEERLTWVDEIRDLGRRVAALTAVLVAEADEAGSAMRARHTRLEDWMARTGQETPREASGTVWAAGALSEGRQCETRLRAARSASVRQRRSARRWIRCRPAWTGGYRPGLSS